MAPFDPAISNNRVRLKTSAPHSGLGMAEWMDKSTATTRDRIPREENRVLRVQLGSRRLRFVSAVAWPPRPRFTGDSDEPRSQLETIKAALAEARGRVSGPSGAAAKLRIPPSTLETRIKALNINKHQFKFG
jgi:transcriptional regulator with GAF, ATPase, and Fis domain